MILVGLSQYTLSNKNIYNIINSIQILLIN